MTPIEEVAQCIAAWDEEGLGDCPELHETNYPDAWDDVRALVERLTEPAAPTAPSQPPWTHPDFPRTRTLTPEEFMSIEDMG